MREKNMEEKHSELKIRSLSSFSSWQGSRIKVLKK